MNNTKKWKTPQRRKF